MIQNTLEFSTTFNIVPSTSKFVLSDLSPYSDEGISLNNVIGVFKIEGPSGIVYNNTNFATPDIVANTSLIFDTVLLPLDSEGEILKGTYKITYTARVSGGVQPGDYSKVNSIYFCYAAPEGKIEVTNSVRLAKVTSKDLTSYAIDGVMPSIARTHTLFYPSALELSPIIDSGSQIVLSYPNVYTGTYTGKIQSNVSYVFSDGLIVNFIIKDVDETIVDNSTMCDIYCGRKNLTNELIQAKAIGDFGKAGKLQETLSLISILTDLYDGAITCGKDTDASYWLNQIILLANITVGCGCDDDTPVQVIPEGGGSGSSSDVDVVGDSSFGTSVTPSVVGSTTTYTVRLTQAYKNLILNALQSQDLSVAAFRSAGIPEEARGVAVTPVSSGGGTISLTPGVSKKVLVLTGNASLSAALTVQAIGTPIDGDSFVVDYRAVLVPGSNSVTIFGLTLSPSEVASGDSLVYTWYSASTATWYSKLISNSTGSSSQDGLAYWIPNPDYALTKTVLYGTNPSYIYKNTQSSGSGSNAPTGTTGSNTWWQFVGNKSALYDSADNIVFDVTSGKPFIIPALNDSISTFNFLVIEGQEIKKRAQFSTPLSGFKLQANTILLGNVSNIAAEVPLSTAYLRTIPIHGITGNTFSEITIPTSGTVVVSPATSTPSVKLVGTTTLIGATSINPLVSAAVNPGDYFWFDFRANVTTSGNVLTIAGVVISAPDALAGNFAIYAYYDSSLSVWFGRKINYNVVLPIGTVNQTVRYNASNVLEADPNVTQDALGNLKAVKSISIIGNTAGDRSIVSGTGNTDTGTDNDVSGISNNTNGSRHKVAGNGNTVAGLDNNVNGVSNNVNGAYNNVNGNGNTVLDNNATVNGNVNNPSGVRLVIGDNNTGNGSISYILGDYNNLNNREAFIYGINGKAFNDKSRIYSNSPIANGKVQFTESLFYINTSGASGAFMVSSGSTTFKFGPDECHMVLVRVSAYQTGGASGTIGDSAGMLIKLMVKSIGGVYSIVGSQIVDGAFSDASASTWTAVVASAASGFTIVTTGQANKVINWTAHVSTINAG